MKVLTMLLGEFDFVDLMVDDPTTPWMAKVPFAIFLHRYICHICDILQLCIDGKT